MAGKRNRRAAAPKWSRWNDERILALRLCDLGLGIEGTEVDRRIRRLHRELERRGLRFRPHVWLSDEWFSPDRIPGFAVPFYLAHPRLLRLERRQILEAEGDSLEWSLCILRHETGHAIDHAYRLHRRKKFRETFGDPGRPYPRFYRALPFTRRYVLNLDSWYGQGHPSEDFAETFAVWLQYPERIWRERHAGWSALRKLEIVDEWMQEIAGVPPPVRSRARVDPISRQRRTIGEYYAAKREALGSHRPSFHDRDLRWLFSDRPHHLRRPPAAPMLDRLRPVVREIVAGWTGQYQYTLDSVLRDMVDRCRELGLRAHDPEEVVKLETVSMLTAQTMNYLHSGKHRLAP